MGIERPERSLTAEEQLSRAVGELVASKRERAGRGARVASRRGGEAGSDEEAAIYDRSGDNVDADAGDPYAMLMERGFVGSSTPKGSRYKASGHQRLNSEQPDGGGAAFGEGPDCADEPRPMYLGGSGGGSARGDRPSLVPKIVMWTVVVALCLGGTGFVVTRSPPPAAAAAGPEPAAPAEAATASVASLPAAAKAPAADDDTLAAAEEPVAAAAPSEERPVELPPVEAEAKPEAQTPVAVEEDEKEPATPEQEQPQEDDKELATPKQEQPQEEAEEGQQQPPEEQQQQQQQQLPEQKEEQQQGEDTQQQERQPQQEQQDQDEEPTWPLPKAEQQEAMMRWGVGQAQAAPSVEGEEPVAPDAVAAADEADGTTPDAAVAQPSSPPDEEEEAEAASPPPPTERQPGHEGNSAEVVENAQETREV